VPELSRFFGIIIRMFAEPGSTHHAPHFHAYYQGEVGIFSFDPVEIIGGSLPRRQRRLVEAWAELHELELLADWQRLQEGRSPASIEPLK
jgi:Domain of unknown function (DUF4160)